MAKKNKVYEWQTLGEQTLLLLAGIHDILDALIDDNNPRSDALGLINRAISNFTENELKHV